jgi:glycosyltransferase involved in cell wall biosynthesis
MRNLKFEIIIPYYKRPKIVINTLNSIKNSTYNNWHLTFIDDSGDDSFKDTFFNFGFDESKASYIPIMMSDEEKIKLGGTVHGKYMNDAIYDSDADIILPICDDDALVNDYMEKLNEYYNLNESVMWSYCHLNFYNPNKESYLESKPESKDDLPNYPYLNSNIEPLNPYMRKDFSQVTFRRNAIVEKEIKYPYPKDHDLDAAIFEPFFKSWGYCYFNGLRGQHKGWHEEQLGVRIKTGKGHFVSPQQYL